MKYLFEDRLAIVKAYLLGQSDSEIKKAYGINRNSLFVWAKRYRLYGSKGLERHLYIKADYSFKIKIVQEHQIIK